MGDKKFADSWISSLRDNSGKSLENLFHHFVYQGDIVPAALTLCSGVEKHLSSMLKPIVTMAT